MSRNHSSVSQHSLWTLVFCATVLLNAATPSFATTAAGNEGDDKSVNDVLSDRHCKLAAKQERCDWVKRDHKLTGH